MKINLNTALDDVLNNAPCGFISFTDDGMVKTINETFLRLLGRPKEAVEGHHISRLLTVGSRIFYQTHLFPLLKMRGSVDEIYLSLRSENGNEIPVLLNAIRRQRNDAEVSDCIVIPMRQRDRFEEELLNARNVAEEAKREKDQAYTALAEAHKTLEEVNVELEAQAEELQVQQEHLQQLNSQLHERVKREALLNRIGYSLRVTGNAASETILNECVSLLANALEADRCYFVEYDINGKQVRVTAAWHRADLDPIANDSRMLDYHSTVAPVYRADGLLVIEDSRNAATVTTTSAAPSAVPIREPRSLVSVALFKDGVLTASLNVSNVLESRVWTGEDVELVQAVATLTRLAVDEARLREQSRRIAEQLQGALQPVLPSNVRGLKLSAYYQPALVEASVGGDFYDVFPLSDNCYVLVVADLSGKGLKAAAHIASVRHMLRTLLYDPRTTISEAVTTLNELLVEHALIEGFATVFIGVYDDDKRILRYVNAGQEPGLLHQSSTGDILRLNPTGPVLGGFSGATFTEQTINVTPGDVLALFTDGLTEAGLDRKNQLEIDGLEAIFAKSVLDPQFSVDDVANRIIDGVTSIATAVGLQDDVCLLVARVD